MPQRAFLRFNSHGWLPCAGLLLVALLAPACDGCLDPASTPRACNRSDDCPEDMFCDDGVCAFGARVDDAGSTMVDSAWPDTTGTDTTGQDLARPDTTRWPDAGRPDLQGVDTANWPDTWQPVDSARPDAFTPIDSSRPDVGGSGDDAALFNGWTRGQVAPGSGVLQGSRYRLQGGITDGYAPSTVQGQRYRLRLREQPLW